MAGTVIVGASSGLGRCIGVGLAQRARQVALLARRKDMLESAAQEAGDGALAIECDVTDEASCRSAIETAASQMGGIDALVYAAATGPLVRLADADADTWRRTFDTNVVGAALVTAAAMPYLTAATGTVVYMSTTGASYTPPWPGLGVYQVTKAALDRLVDSWRVEHPTVGFTRLTIGECGGGEGDAQTQFAAEWDRALVGELAPTWFARNLLGSAMIDVEHLVSVVSGLLSAGPSLVMPSVTVIPRPRPLG